MLNLAEDFALVCFIFMSCNHLLPWHLILCCLSVSLERFHDFLVFRILFVRFFGHSLITIVKTSLYRFLAVHAVTMVHSNLANRLQLKKNSGFFSCYHVKVNRWTATDKSQFVIGRRWESCVVAEKKIKTKAACEYCCWLDKKKP